MAKIRLGMVGGGKDAFIGAVHRIAARIDGQFDLVAGALSSTPEKARESGLALGLAADRCYGSFEEMAATEAARPDGVEAVAIVTPNHVHAAASKAFLARGIHVICDKPLTATMEQAATQALELVQQLSEVAYLEERKVILQKAPAQLAPILERVLRKLEPLARKKHQVLHWELHAEVSSQVDSNRLASILDNLIENAIKYGPLESRIEVLLEVAGDRAVVRVRDQGPGIPEDQRVKLFTMFGKVGNRPTGKETSTGLGLYIAKMLSELHGGHLEQENLTPGNEFRLLLPAE